MDPNFLLIIIAVFVFVAAVALCIQAGLLFGMYRTARVFEQKVFPMLPKLDALLDSSRSAVDEGRKQMAEITTKAQEILDSTKKQLVRVDEVLEDATTRAKVQMDRVEMVVDDTVQRAHQTVTMVHGGIIKPIKELQGLSAGLKAALGTLLHGRNGPIHADEEMFI